MVVGETDRGYDRAAPEEHQQQVRVAQRHAAPGIETASAAATAIADTATAWRSPAVRAALVRYVQHPAREGQAAHQRRQQRSSERGAERDDDEWRLACQRRSVRYQAAVRASASSTDTCADHGSAAVAAVSTVSEPHRRATSARLAVRTPPICSSAGGTESNRTRASQSSAQPSHQFGGGQVFAVRHQPHARHGAAARQQCHDEIAQVPDVDEASPVMDRRQGQRNAPVHPLHQSQKIRTHTRPIDQRRPHDRHLHEPRGGGPPQLRLAFELGACLGIPRVGRVVGAIGARVRSSPFTLMLLR